MNLADYLESIGGSASSRSDGGLEFMLDCPYCGKKGHLYVCAETEEPCPRCRKPREGHWTCFRCNKASCSILYLVAEIEGCSVPDAGKILLVDMIPRSLPRTREPTSAPVFIDEPLPEEFEPVWDGKVYRMPRYLSQRGISRETARRFGLGFAMSGHYGSRIVLPIDCPLGRSFTTRRADGGQNLRYLAGEGAGRLLFGWQVAMPADRLVVVEGPFDCLKAHQAGFPVVAIMGKDLRQTQLVMLQASGVQRITLLLDPEMLDHAIEQAVRLSGEVYIARLEGHDPGDSQAADIVKAIEQAKPLAKARLVSIASALAARLVGLDKVDPPF